MAKRLTKEQQMVRALVNHTKARVAAYQATIAKLQYELQTARVTIIELEEQLLTTGGPEWAPEPEVVIGSATTIDDLRWQYRQGQPLPPTP